MGSPAKNLQPEEFNQVVEDIKSLRKQIMNDTSEISLQTYNAEFSQNDLNYVVNEINSNRTKLGSALYEVVASIITTVKSMTKSSQTLDSILNETSQLADYSTTIASAGEELSATINSISQNVQNTVNASGEARKLANAGSEVINETVEKIDNVSNVLNETNNLIARLQATSEKANNIVKVVSDISAKTDLLALNASIEAARAGVAGKGFAVVAHEVGRLSEKTQASINEIEDILKNIQKDVGEVYKSLELGSNTANDALKTVNVAQDAITDIVQQIGQVDNEVSNISSAIVEQGQAVSDIAQNVTTISSGSQEVNNKVISLGEMINQVTLASNGTRMQLSKFNLGPAAIILQSQVDHLFWVHRLRRMLEGKESIRQEEFVDHTQCRLGKWYLSVDKTQCSPRFQQYYTELDGPHSKLHATAAQIIRDYNSGHKDQAFKNFESVRPLSDQIIDILEGMIEEVKK